MADVARLAGVSVTTVSFVINDRPGTGLRTETKERVRAAIAELGYRPNYQARALARRTSQTVGFVGEGLGTPYASRMISGAHDVAREHDSLLLILDAEDEDELAESVSELYARRVDGILVAAEGTKTLRLPPDVAKLPAMLVNCRVPGTTVPSLLPDEELGGRTVARLLLDAGHRQVAYLAGDPHAWATQQRVRGFRAELATAGISGRSVPVHYGDYRAETGYQLTLALMSRRRRPTGLFLGNDRMALGAYFALTELGLTVPGDVSIIGYDDQEELADSMRPGLTTVRLPFYEMGRQAAQALFDRSAHSAQREMLVPCPVVHRGSLAGGPAASKAAGTAAEPVVPAAAGTGGLSAPRAHLA